MSVSQIRLLWERELARIKAGTPPPNGDNPPRRHHYVPQMYLERFADRSGAASRIGRIDMSRGPDSLITLGVRDSAVETDFYTVHVGDPARGHEAEHILGLFETTAGYAFAKFDERPDHFPDDVDRESLALFMALQFSRVHDTFDFHKEMYTKITAMVMRVGAATPDYVRNFLREQNLNASDEAVASMCASLREHADVVAVTPDRNQTIASMLNGATELFRYFFKRRWVVARSQISFLTSDRPIVLVRDKKAETWEGVGVGTAESIIFPLDRNRVLIMSHPLRENGEGLVEVDASFAQRLNVLIANNARRWLFHHPDDRPLAGVPYRAVER